MIEKFMFKDKKRKLLIVEDEYVNREILNSVLSNDYDLMMAEDGLEALKNIEENKNTISLILLDLVIPKISGIELLEEINSNNELQNIPVVVVTSDKEQEVKCLNLGAADFISKPYPGSSIILARIKRIIELYEDRNTINYTEKDSLTNLLTKEYFYKYANDYDIRYKKKNMDSIMIKIRDLHIIKERFGINYSNNILINFANRLIDIMPKINGIVCKNDSESFLIYCPNLDDYNQFYNEISNNDINIQIGVYQNVDKKIDIDMRFERAEMALDKIKGNMSKYIEFYDEKLKEKEIYEAELIDEFPKALNEKQFIVYYQPKYNIKGEKSILSSAEALVRWNHPKFGLISPKIFITLFEEKGLIGLLDHYVWSEVGKQINQWKLKYNTSIPVSVNVSRVDLYNPHLIDDFNNIIKDNNLDYSDLLLEITESACTDETDNIISRIEELRKIGFKIEMDDFGTGYSSLSMISKMPLDALKIDMIFIKNAFENKKANKMIEIILDIASYLNVPTIAEGVETKEQVLALKEMGCDIVQGYYFSKPIPVNEFDDFLLNKKEM